MNLDPHHCVNNQRQQNCECLPLNYPPNGFAVFADIMTVIVWDGDYTLEDMLHVTMMIQVNKHVSQLHFIKMTSAINQDTKLPSVSSTLNISRI